MERTCWGVKWRSKNALDGERSYLIGRVTAPHGDGHPIVQPAGDQTPLVTFATRQAARAFIRDRYGYIATRPDLRAEPHGWRLPIPVRIKITVAEVK